MLLDYENKIIQAKIVYYGPAMSGKTTSLRFLFKKFGKEQDLKSIETTTGRTLFFDFGTLKLTGNDWTVKFLLYTATGQDFYASTRPATLYGVDGIVFVFDSQSQIFTYNENSWKELKEFFDEEIYEIPIVICLNKWDLDDTVDESALATTFELYKYKKVKIQKTVAKTGEGICESFSSLLNFLDLTN
jgi:hypothetical protein